MSAQQEPSREITIRPVSNVIETELRASARFSNHSVSGRAEVILKDLLLLARCAQTKCTITYKEAIKLRGRGVPWNGLWLDNVYEFAVSPLGFPDLTMLVVNKHTGLPSKRVFVSGHTRLSGIPIETVADEQRRCMQYEGYEEILGRLDPISNDKIFARIRDSENDIEREISRAVANATIRIGRAGIELRMFGRMYPGSVSRSELKALAEQLWTQQNGRCALTGKPFEMKSDETGGVPDDRVSLDRIDNSLGYCAGNTQLVTQFANRARGQLPVEEARRRLVQFS